MNFFDFFIIAAIILGILLSLRAIRKGKTGCCRDGCDHCTHKDCGCRQGHSEDD